MKNRGNMTLSLGHNNLPVRNTKDMKICDFLDKELKIAILKKLGELQEDTERQFGGKAGQQW